MIAIYRLNIKSTHTTVLIYKFTIHHIFCNICVGKISTSYNMLVHYDNFDYDKFFAKINTNI